MYKNAAFASGKLPVQSVKRCVDSLFVVVSQKNIYWSEMRHRVGNKTNTNSNQSNEKH